MRVLVVSPFQPHPEADHGGGVYLGLMIRELQAQAEVAVAHYAHRGDGETMPGVTHFSTPRLRKNEVAGLARLGQLFRFGLAWGLRGTPLEVAKMQSAAFRATLRQAVDAFRPDVVLVEFAVMAWCLEDLADQTTVLTDHERGFSVPRKIGPGTFGVRRDRGLWDRFVRRFYPRASLVQALTPEDAEALAATSGRPVEVRGSMIETPGEIGSRLDTAPVMLFFGNYRHHPNTETAASLATEVLPRVRRTIPDAELWLAGPHADATTERLADQPGVRILGYVPDLAETLAAARCLVAPVQRGWGVRIKALLGMAHGLPLVTNQRGAQGIHPPPEACSLGESWEELAAACLRFLADAPTAERAGQAARRFVLASHSGAGLASQQLARFSALLDEARPRAEDRNP